MRAGEFVDLTGPGSIGEGFGLPPSVRVDFIDLTAVGPKGDLYAPPPSALAGEIVDLTGVWSWSAVDQAEGARPYASEPGLQFQLHEPLTEVEKEKLALRVELIDPLKDWIRNMRNADRLHVGRAEKTVDELEAEIAEIEQKLQEKNAQIIKLAGAYSGERATVADPDSGRLIDRDDLTVERVERLIKNLKGFLRRARADLQRSKDGIAPYLEDWTLPPLYGPSIGSILEDAIEQLCYALVNVRNMLVFLRNLLEFSRGYSEKLIGDLQETMKEKRELREAATKLLNEIATYDFGRTIYLEEEAKKVKRVGEIRKEAEEIKKAVEGNKEKVLKLGEQARAAGGGK